MMAPCDRIQSFSLKQLDLSDLSPILGPSVARSRRERESALARADDTAALPRYELFSSSRWIKAR